MLSCLFEVFLSVVSFVCVVWVCFWLVIGVDVYVVMNGVVIVVSNSEWCVGECFMNEVCFVGNGGLK